ncbi:MAG TPA: protein kinase [Acidimicrobiales bacterium]|nr:protein kinase [Acidimicrobiales bacterium]
MTAAGYAWGVGVQGTEDRVVAGRYARQVLLGRGGFGTVWRAHDLLLQRDVAIKEIVFPAILDEAEQAAIREKVLREARAAARLSHPNAVTVFDVIDDEGHPLIVMELVDAPTLAELVAREGPLDEQRAAALGAEVLDALAAAHSQGIIHRDVKPANVMVSADGRVRLTDFGIASITDDPKLTTSGIMAGSPSYMAPEQAQNEPTSAATDLWGLGATLYFAVEGEGPFDRGAVIPTLTAVVNDEPRPTQRATALAPLLGELLTKDSQQRPSVQEVRRRLIDISDKQPPGAEAPDATAEFDAITVRAALQSAAPAEPGEYAPPAVEPARAPATGAPTESPRAPTQPAGLASRRRPLLVGAILAIAALIAVVLTTSGDDGEPPPQTAGPSTSQAASPERADTGAPAEPDVPVSWVPYRDPATGFTIAHPPGWSVRRDGSLTDFRDSATGAYLRVDYTKSPGPSPVDDWYAFEPEFAAKNAGYRRMQITPTTYAGYPAANWEFTYGPGLHAVDLGFVAGPYGFALNFQAPEKDWQRLQPIFEQFKSAFRAPT